MSYDFQPLNWVLTEASIIYPRSPLSVLSWETSYVKTYDKEALLGILSSTLQRLQSGLGHFQQAWLNLGVPINFVRHVACREQSHVRQLGSICFSSLQGVKCLTGGKNVETRLLGIGQEVAVILTRRSGSGVRPRLPLSCVEDNEASYSPEHRQSTTQNQVRDPAQRLVSHNLLRNIRFQLAIVNMRRKAGRGGMCNPAGHNHTRRISGSLRGLEHRCARISVFVDSDSTVVGFDGA